MLLASFLTLFLALIACSDGKKVQERLKVINCTGSSPFKEANSTELYYHIVSTNSSCMHFVWSTVKYPTLYVSHTKNESKNCSCEGSKFDYTSYINDQKDGSVDIPGKDSPFSLAISFTRIIEFDATDKKLAQEALNRSCVCNSESSTSLRFTDLSTNISWEFESDTATFVGTLKHANTSSKPNITLFRIRTKVPEFVKENRLDYFPKTLFTENSTTFDLVIKDFEYVLNQSRSRLALETVVVHGVNVKSGNITIKKTSDDEFTPSVFSTYTYNTSGKNDGEDPSLGGFIQWKPISYQSDKRKSTTSQQVYVLESASVEECQLDEIPVGLASALYNSNNSKNSDYSIYEGVFSETDIRNITRWFVVIGTSGNNNYYNSDYSTWTVVTGYGDVPMDSYSSVIIITIIVGVGIPASLVLVGGVYIFIRKKPWQNLQRFINSRSGRGYTRLS